MKIRFYGGTGLKKNIKQKILNREYEPKQLMSIYNSFGMDKKLTKIAFVFNVISFFFIFFELAYQISNGFNRDVEQVILCNFIFYIICVAIFYYRLFLLERKQFIKAIKQAYPEILDEFYSIMEKETIFNNKKELNNNDKLTIDVAKILYKLYKIIKQEPMDITKKNNKYILFRIKDKCIAKNCSVENILLLKKRIKERVNTIGYELTTGWIIKVQEEEELTSKITIQINNDNIVKISYQKEIDIPQFDETIKAIEEIIKNKYNQQFEINCITSGISSISK